MEFTLVRERFVREHFFPGRSLMKYKLYQCEFCGILVPLWWTVRSNNCIWRDRKWLIK